MEGIQISSALLRTRLVSRPPREQDAYFASGQGTKPATEAYKRQAAALAAERVAKAAARRRPTSEERAKEVDRRKRWAFGGNMPPNIRNGFSEAEMAALSVIADRCRKKGFCDICVDEVARLAGVGRTSVQNAIRKARSKERALISVRERPQHGAKNLTNVIKIICKSWLAWIGRAIGFKRPKASETGVKNSLSSYVATVKGAFERECVEAFRSSSSTNENVENHSKGWVPPSRWAHSSGGAAHG
ncbi:hypothetical protein [Neorhizobium sp. DAR64860/K0K1]|uniref:hypothetical protein n=1 Tax=Neorhizobium sp. DAR64860/K0K1 TaxID=3421955 RepID=UPI003D2E5E9B